MIENGLIIDCEINKKRQMVFDLRWFRDEIRNRETGDVSRGTERKLKAESRRRFVEHDGEM